MSDQDHISPRNVAVAFDRLARGMASLAFIGAASCFLRAALVVLS